MGPYRRSREFFLCQLGNWPGAELEDLLKGAHQSVFGPGHFVTDDCIGRLKQELADLPPEARGRGIEPLDGPWCRFHLTHLRESGLSPETLARAFQCSARRPQGTVEDLERRLSVLQTIGDKHQLPWKPQEVAAAIEDWRQAGFPPCHHSETVRQAFHPAYRVLHRDYAWMLPLLGQLDRLVARKGGGIVAIEGGSASGKTTLAAQLAELYDCRVFHMDDFFLQPHQRTEERYGEPGGNVDRERFLEEVLLPASRGETVSLRRYDCRTQTILPAVDQGPKALTIVEGAYSLHPQLAPYYDLSVFLAVDPKIQRSRIEVRNRPEDRVRFFDTWIPLEQRYFQAMGPQGRCDLTLEVSPCEW